MDLLPYLVFKSMPATVTSPNVVVVLHGSNTSSQQILLNSTSAKETGLSLVLSKPLKTGFAASRSIICLHGSSLDAHVVSAAFT